MNLDSIDAVGDKHVTCQTNNSLKRLSLATEDQLASCSDSPTASMEQALPEKFIVVRRRRMTKSQHERLRRAARKMVQDVKKFVKRKRL